MRKSVVDLAVTRVLESGDPVAVGRLAQSTQGVFFQYAADYLSRFGNLSPFRLKADDHLQRGPREPHQGLHGVFADSLPDGWGLLLQDRWFRRQGVSLNQVTQMDRLALVGVNGLGAIQYAEPLNSDRTEGVVELGDLGTAAQQIDAGRDSVRLDQLVEVGSSGGARPKAHVYAEHKDLRSVRLVPLGGDTGWIVKFTTDRGLLRHEEGVCEAAILTLAEEAALKPVEWTLVGAPEKSSGSQWLAVKRFDLTDTGRFHVATASGLLDADFRMPSLDYSDLIQCTRELCRSPALSQLMYRRAVFNLLVCNQDDHAKNHSFLQNDEGRWDLSPAYDLTFSPHPYNEHSTGFLGYGERPPVEILEKLGERASYASPAKSRAVIRDLIENVSKFEQVSKDLGISKPTREEIARRLGAQCEHYASQL
jgi:serine/threonine-protein kinase HipA